MNEIRRRWRKVGRMTVVVRWWWWWWGRIAYRQPHSSSWPTDHLGYTQTAAGVDDSLLPGVSIESGVLVWRHACEAPPQGTISNPPRTMETPRSSTRRRRRRVKSTYYKALPEKRSSGAMLATLSLLPTGNAAPRARESSTTTTTTMAQQEQE